jgi:hypothetical protein
LTIQKIITTVTYPNTILASQPKNSKVYVVDYDINSANILLVSNGEKFLKELMPEAHIYYEYYGSGLSSVVFQEIRESKASPPFLSDKTPVTSMQIRTISVG